MVVVGCVMGVGGSARELGPVGVGVGRVYGWEDTTSWKTERAGGAKGWRAAARGGQVVVSAGLATSMVLLPRFSNGTI